MKLPMKRFACFLVLLLLLAQVDDVLAVAPILPSVPVSDADEYLPAQRQPREELAVRNRESSQSVRDCANTASGHQGAPVCLKPCLPGTFAPSTLYVFMSLQT
jgi:hypothetical protein